MQKTYYLDAINADPLLRAKALDWLDDGRNVAIEIEGDVFMFDFMSDGVYQIHFLACQGGKATIARARLAFTRMFHEHKATVLFGMIPDYRRDVKLMARWVGGKFSHYERGPQGLIEVYIVSKEPN